MAMRRDRRMAFGFRLGALLLWLLPNASALAQSNTVPTAAELAASPSEAARAAIVSFDLSRLVRERAYAEEMLRHVETLDADDSEGLYSEDREGIRLMALAALGRRQEAQAGIDRLMLANPTDVQLHIDAWWSALILEDHARAVGVLEGASRRVQEADWLDLRLQIGPAVPRAMFRYLSGNAARPFRVRLAAALLRIGWPGDADRVTSDDLRMMLLDDRLAQGDVSGAREIASTIRTPPAILPLIVLRRYDEVIGTDRDRLAMFRAALAEEDRETAATITGTSPSVDHLLARARYLRAVGRNAEAWTLVEPMTRDVAATVGANFSGAWLIDQAVGILYALDRKDEAVALNRRLVAVPLTVNPDLINLYINHITLLWEAGLNAEALDHARQVERDHGDRANAYGRMWISSGIVCTLAELGRAEEAAPVLARMRAASEDNLAAMIRGHVCLGDMAAAEALLIRRLEVSDSLAAPLGFQEFELDHEPQPRPHSARMRALRERPAVQAALNRVARTLQLPLAEYTWY